MKTRSIDIETYSSAPLQKSGVYRYVEAEDFEILLFGYSVDSGPVQVVDLAYGEHIPKEILQALEDEEVIKWAFNATFERNCLSRYLGYPTGDYLNPESWRCSMIWAGQMTRRMTLTAQSRFGALSRSTLTFRNCRSGAGEENWHSLSSATTACRTKRAIRRSGKTAGYPGKRRNT